VAVSRSLVQPDPRLARGTLKLAGADAVERPLAAKRLLDPAERLWVRATAGGGEVGLGEESVGRVGQPRDRIANPGRAAEQTVAVLIAKY
jgi:hypothetical protein